MSLKLLDPIITSKLLEGHEDVITPLAEERKNFYQNQNCPHCDGNSLTMQGDSKTMFRGNDPLPRYTLSCDNCDCLFDPHSGLILSMGNRAKAFVPSVPLIDGPED